ncbi:hypothetical protein Zmor_027989 [Zophobas morio]|uniref:Uncharacterized protein n=1 Tax=Zophobas morio TaxID=2755281 RepID=A0AA38M3T7_9CUCU|nr:hypothetical protein Zmor_027989 [Zophobas morio]
MRPNSEQIGMNSEGSERNPRQSDRNRKNQRKSNGIRRIREIMRECVQIPSRSERIRKNPKETPDNLTETERIRESNGIRKNPRQTERNQGKQKIGRTWKT